MIIAALVLSALALVVAVGGVWFVISAIDATPSPTDRGYFDRR